MTSVDHVIVACPDLEAGVRMLQQATGVRAARGGKHPQWGTHNALLSLGDRIYLEILAPDPDAPNVSGPLGTRAAQLIEPRLFTWAASVSEIETVDALLRKSGWETSGVSEGSRARPDGSVLRWKSMRLTAITDPVIPFLIEWDAGSPHPSLDSPSGCTLERFTIHHPDASRIREILQALDVQTTVMEAPEAQLHAALKTPAGPFELH